ncbi:hypothetical protein CH64_3116 [Yersinia rohdei]|uniref:Uncharacterized protein n=1 Tax=Yersinia rohdei TaxID=29485 RepID=A0ABM5S8G7_YERRO|nr:hypothetical protein CH64_3116 [Yersinia rohdei]
MVLLHSTTRQPVRCRAGSLESQRGNWLHAAVVRCRAGSLEMEKERKEREKAVRCCAGSLETLPLCHSGPRLTFDLIYPI